MSRTTRKPRFFIEESEETYIKRQLSSHYRRWNKGNNYSTKWVRQRKSDEQYKAECEVVMREYNEKLKEATYDSCGRPHIVKYSWSFYTREYGPTYVYLYKPKVPRYKRVQISWSVEQEIEELKKQYRKFTRDGHWNETGRNTGFKKAATKTIRLANRRLANKIMSEQDYDHLSYPNEHDGDYLRWAFW